MSLISKEHLNMAVQSLKSVFNKKIDNGITELNKRIDDSQADWNQNDENSDGYIKNRTHYEEEVTEVILEEQTVEFRRTPAYYIASQISTTFNLIENENYTVVWDGAPYDVTCQYDSVIGGHYLGDKNCLIGGASVGDIPFAIIVSDSTGNASSATKSTEASHVIGITKSTTEIHPIDEKYLPDSVKVTPDWNQNDETAPDYVKGRTHYTAIEDVTILGESSFETIYCGREYGANSSLNSSLTPSEELIEGQTYIVIYDGVKYECVCKPIIANDKVISLYLGNSSLGYNIISSNLQVDTGEPFLFHKPTDYDYYNFRDNVYAASTHTLSIKIKDKEFVYQLDQKYIPDTIARAVDENDALTLVAEMGLVEPVAAEDGSIYTDENGVVYSL